MGESAPLTGPDFTKGIASADVPPNGTLLGHVNGEAVLLLRRGAEVLAIGATCTHYSSSLKDGFLEGETIRCPWHHAAFNVRTGEAVEGPAFTSLPCWSVTDVDGHLTVTTKRPPPPSSARHGPTSVVIIGGGAAGISCAEELRRRGYEGSVTVVDRDVDPPVDRPNLSKDSLAGTSPEAWLWLHGDDFYAEQRIVRRRATVTAIDRQAKKVSFDDGTSLGYGALVLATGATPVTLSMQGEGPRVLTLRTASDMRAIIAACANAKRAVVIGASFIGLEVAASLRHRGLEVQVVGRDALPLGSALGPQLGAMVRAIHERHGVVFHPMKKAVGLVPSGVTLSDGVTLEADVVVAGAGVTPSTELAQAAGLAVDRGVVVDTQLRTSDSFIFAVGDVARYPDHRSGTNVRIEHWAVAQNQGRTAARNVLGLAEGFRAVPFFWSQHYDVTIGYVGHVDAWDEVVVEGDPLAMDCVVRYLVKGRTMAAATVNRDAASLALHAAFSQE